MGKVSLSLYSFSRSLSSKIDTRNLSFKVSRQSPKMIVPAKPTPTDLKPLSDIDDRDGLRYRTPFVLMYRNNPFMANKDPVKVIREALAKALVFYYPFAGMLREGPNRKLTVDCTGEGIVFVEADADFTIDQLGDPLHPPFPFERELFYDVPDYPGILDCPLMSVQVTRLQCGGFIFGSWYCHAMSDACGIVQFMVAVGEMAREASTPSVLPVWKRKLLNARDPPQVTCTHREFIDLPTVNTSSAIIPTENNTVYRHFYFDITKVSALRNLVPPHLAKCSTFDLLAACVWRCRTIALQLHLDQKVRLAFTVNGRSRFNPPLPKGYYGNVCVLPGAISTVKELCYKPLAYALELVMRAKADVTEEYVRSFIDLTVMKGRAPIPEDWTYILVDLTRLGFCEPDFGWGKPVYGGTGHAEVDPTPGTGNYFICYKNRNGDQEGVVAPICLPTRAMERFELELKRLLMVGDQHS